MKTAIALTLAVLALPALAEQKFNPYSGEWETTTPDAEVEYNPYSGKHEYVPHPQGREPELEYSPYNDTWEHVPDTSEPQESQESNSLWGIYD